MAVYLPAVSAEVLSGVIGWAIVDRHGIEHDITWNTNQEVFVPKGTKGLGYADVQLSVEKRPFARGSTLRHIATNPIEISLPLIIHMPTHSSLMTKVEQVRDWFYTGDENSRTPAYLKVTRPQDDTSRQIPFYYNGGFGGDLEEGSPNFAPFVIRLFCPDPDWLDTVETEVVFPQASLLGANTVITNSGDVSAYPIFRWNGPGNNLIIRNETTGRGIFLNNSGGAFIVLNESVIIDTRPPTDRTTLPVINTSGVSLYQLVDPASRLDLWLEPGANTIFMLVQDTSSSSSVSMSYLQRYRGVLR